MNNNIVMILAGTNEANLEHNASFKDTLAQPCNDIPLLRSVVFAYLESYVGEVHVIIGGDHVDARRMMIEDLPVHIHEIPARLEGKNASIPFGLSQLASEPRTVLLANANTPNLTPIFIRHIVNFHREGWISRPLHAGKPGHPVCIDRSYFHELQNLRSDDGLERFALAHRNATSYFPDISGASSSHFPIEISGSYHSIMRLN